MVQLLFSDQDTHMPLPFVDEGVRAGFPTPASDKVEESLDLNRDLIKHPAATFYARVLGDSMEPDMFHGDILLIDRAIEPYDGCIAVCALDGDFTVKELDLSLRSQGKVRLIPHNPNYAVIEVEEGTRLDIWGVVKYVIHKMK